MRSFVDGAASRRRTWAMLGLATLLSWACGGGTDAPPPQPTPDTPTAPVERAAMPARVRAALDEATCLTCHVIEDEGEPAGPSLTHVGSRMDAASIRRKILDPISSTSPGYENMEGQMPQDFAERLSGEQIDALVEYLATLR